MSESFTYFSNQATDRYFVCGCAGYLSSPPAIHSEAYVTVRARELLPGPSCRAASSPVCPL